MYSHRLKYVIAATVLSCLLVNKADAASVAPSKSELATPSVSAKIAAPSLVQNFIQSLTSVSFAIEVPAEEEEEDENSPIIPVDTTEEKEESLFEEQESNKEKFPDDNTEESENAPSSSLDMAAVFAAAGLTYDEDVDLPVFSQGVSLKGQELSPVPRVTSCRSEGQIAITYSDGPSNTTACIARQLINAQTRVNFFVNTRMLKDQQYGIVLQRIYNAGHLIGMTYRLPTEDPSTMRDQDIRADIIDNAHKIESLIHVAPKYVRLHFSAQKDGRTEHILRDLGFILVGYNLDGKDYVHKTPELVEQEYRHTFQQYQQANDQKKGSFISIQYDIPQTSSLDAVPYVIKLVQDEGYTAVRMDGCLNDREPYKISAAGLGYIGDKFSYGTPGYKSGQHVAASIISDTTAEEEIRGLTADDAFLNTSSSAVSAASLSKLGYVVMPALVYAFSTMM